MARQSPSAILLPSDPATFVIDPTLLQASLPGQGTGLGIHVPNAVAASSPRVARIRGRVSERHDPTVAVGRNLNAVRSGETLTTNAMMLLSVEDLKKQCRSRRLPVSGKKGCLRDRLRVHCIEEPISEEECFPQHPRISPRSTLPLTELPPDSSLRGSVRLGSEDACTEEPFLSSGNATGPLPNALMTAPRVSDALGQPAPPASAVSHMSFSVSVNGVSQPSPLLASPHVLSTPIFNSAASFDDSAAVADGDRDESSESETSSEESEQREPADAVHHHHISAIYPKNAKASAMIYGARHKGARRTEDQVLKLANVWIGEQIASGLLQDGIVDTNLMNKYLEHEATRPLRNIGKGKRQDFTARLSSSALGKVKTMLMRLRTAQCEADPNLNTSRPLDAKFVETFMKHLSEQADQQMRMRDNFDVSKNSLLDSRITPQQFDEISWAILTKIQQVPTLVRAWFCWNFMVASLNRGDEMLKLGIVCCQPHSIQLQGVERRGILGLHYDSKTARGGEPLYTFVIPHRNPLQCAVAALAMYLHYIFDQEKLLEQFPDWKWEEMSTWKSVQLLRGKTVGKMCTPDCLNKMFKLFLEPTSIQSSKVTHLPRKAMPTILENMGVTADAIDAVGHWRGNTRREVYAAKIPPNAALGLAGFRVEERYTTPWAEIDVPENLANRIFPFADEALKTVNSHTTVNGGARNFLEMLIWLRPFVWRVAASAHQKFPNSLIFKRLDAFHTSAARDWFGQWPDLLSRAEHISESDSTTALAFNEASTRQLVSDTAAYSRKNNDILFKKLDTLAEQNAQILHQLSLVISTSTDSLSGGPSTSNPAVQATLSQPPPQAPQAVSASRVSFQALELVPPVAGTDIRPSVLSPSREGLGCSLEDQSSTSRLDSLVPIVRQDAERRSYFVLPSVSGDKPPYNLNDLIIPEALAFCTGLTAVPRYPRFAISDACWDKILPKISTTHASLIWKHWRPRNIGDYGGLLELWTAWDSGAVVAGVGRFPPLRVLEEEWGSRKSALKGCRSQQSWRPRNEDKVRRHWAQVMKLIRAVGCVMKEDGIRASEAVVKLEMRRAALGLTLSKFADTFKTPKGSLAVVAGANA